MEKTGTAGNQGEKVRSDCKVTVSLTDDGGIYLDLRSKVKAMYGNSIHRLVIDLCIYFDLKNANIKVEDSGALSHVIAARIEAAIKKVSNTKKEYLLPSLYPEDGSSERERFRMTRLYLPGNSPSMMINAGIHNPNAVILDLEDSVAPEKKDEARILVRNSLRNVDFYGAERMVRINQLPLGLEDAAILAPHGVELILLPKCEEAWQVEELEKVLCTTLDACGQKREILLMPIIESALGVENAFKIASASRLVVSMAIGLEDFTADLGVQRTAEGKESAYARSRIVNACKAAGIQPIDSVYSDVANMDGLLENVKQSRALGFEGMGCIHPAQIKVIKKGFMPEQLEVEKAQQIVDAFNDARERGLGVVSIGSKMIDAPVVKRAERTLELARQFHMI